MENSETNSNSKNFDPYLIVQGLNKLNGEALKACKEILLLEAEVPAEDILTVINTPGAALAIGGGRDEVELFTLKVRLEHLNVEVELIDKDKVPEEKYIQDDKKTHEVSLTSESPTAILRKMDLDALGEFDPSKPIHTKTTIVELNDTPIEDIKAAFAAEEKEEKEKQEAINEAKVEEKPELKKSADPDLSMFAFSGAAEKKEHKEPEKTDDNKENLSEQSQVNTESTESSLLKEDEPGSDNIDRITSGELETPQEVEEDVTPSSDINILASHQRKKAALRWLIKGVLVPFILLASIQGIGTYLYFSSKRQQLQATEKEVIQEQVRANLSAGNEKNGGVEQEAELIPQLPRARNFKGSDIKPDKEVAAFATLIGNTEIKFSIDLKAPAPAKKSIEDIANGEKQIIWLSRAEIKEAMAKMDSKGNFEGEGPVKLFVSEGDETNRFVGKVKLTGKLNYNTSNLEINYEMSYGDGVPNAGFVQKVNDMHYKVFVKGEATAEYVPLKIEDTK